MKRFSQLRQSLRRSKATSSALDAATVSRTATKGLFDDISESGHAPQAQSTAPDDEPSAALWDPALDAYVDLDYTQNETSHAPFGWLDALQAIMDPADPAPPQSLQQIHDQDQSPGLIYESAAQNPIGPLLNTTENAFEEFYPSSSYTPSWSSLPTDSTAQLCIQCQQAQYVNKEGRCMVCQHYFDLSISWRPRFSESELYSYRNSSSSSVGSIASMESVASVGSSSTKRGKRITGGYPCRHISCRKVFDVPSERRHHERKHAAKEDRPYGCHCGERFLYPKDLVRHNNNVHKERLSLVKQDPVTESLASILDRDRPPSSSKRIKRRAHSPPVVPAESNDHPVRFEECGQDDEVNQDTNDLRANYHGPGWQSLDPRPKTWLRMIDNLLSVKKGFRDVETSNAIAHLSRQLDELGLHD